MEWLRRGRDRLNGITAKRGFGRGVGAGGGRGEEKYREGESVIKERRECDFFFQIATDPVNLFRSEIFSSDQHESKR